MKASLSLVDEIIASPFL